MGTAHLDGRMRVDRARRCCITRATSPRARAAPNACAPCCRPRPAGAVEIEEFAGGYIRLPEAEQTRMPKGRAAPQHCALGVSATAGAQVWDAQARFIIRFGPLTRAEFDALLPGTPSWLRITQLARLFVGPGHRLRGEPGAAQGRGAGLAGGRRRAARLVHLDRRVAPAPRAMRATRCSNRGTWCDGPGPRMTDAKGRYGGAETRYVPAFGVDASPARLHLALALAGRALGTGGSRARCACSTSAAAAA